MIPSARAGWRARELLGSMLGDYHEHGIAQQVADRPPIGTSTGEPPRGQAHQHQCPETLFCDCRRLGALAAATMPAAQNSVPPSARAVSVGAGAASFGNAARAGGADRQHTVFIDG